MRFQCPQCHAVLELEDGQPGELVQCDQCLTAVTYPSSPTAPGAILGEFVIVRKLGQGGMGTVYLAHQLTLDRDVALKVITPAADTSEADIDSFIREARAAALINHPNIVQAYTVNCDSNLWYFAMEYIDGPTVKALLEQQHTFSPQETLDIAAEIVPGLQYAYTERQMLHRDIKPDNIMLNSAGHAKLADLGLACQATGSAPGEDEITGTPQYLAPELLLGFPADARSDIYSLGATLYHIVTGSAPYDAPTVDELVMKHLTDPLTPVLERRPDTPPPLAVLIEAMLAKRPAQRYQSYDELATDIARVQQGLMPAKPLCAEAQIPIDPDSTNPLELPGDDHSAQTTPHAKKTLKRSKAAAPNAADSQPTPTPDTNSEPAADDNDDTDAPAAKPSRAKAIAAVAALVLLAAAGAAAFLLLKDKPQPTTPTEKATVASAADSAPDSTPAVAETPQTPDADTPTLAQLAELVAQDSDQAFDRAAALLAKAEPAAQAEAYATLAPLAEKRLQTARQPRLDEENNTWKTTVDRLRNERHEKERQEAEDAERKRKEDEERKRQEEQEQKERERQEAIANAKQDKLQKMLDFANEDKFLSATLELQSSFDGETDDLKEWRAAWLAILAQADDIDKLLAPFSPTRNDGVTIPGFVFHKVRPNAASDDENYTTVNLRVLAISDGKVSLAANYDDLLRALPSIQRNRIRRQLDGDENALRNASLQLDVPLDLLLPAQQLALAQAAAKRRQNADADADADAIPTLLAARLLVTGNFPAAVAATPAFQTFRDTTADLDDRLREIAKLDSNALAQRHADNLRRLLALAKPNDRLAGLLIANTLRRYLADLGPDVAKNHEDCQQAIAEANALIRQF